MKCSERHKLVLASVVDEIKKLQELRKNQVRFLASGDSVARLINFYTSVRADLLQIRGGAVNDSRNYAEAVSRLVSAAERASSPLVRTIKKELTDTIEVQVLSENPRTVPVLLVNAEEVITEDVTSLVLTLDLGDRGFQEFTLSNTQDRGIFGDTEATIPGLTRAYGLVKARPVLQEVPAARNKNADTVVRESVDKLNDLETATQVNPRAHAALDDPRLQNEDYLTVLDSMSNELVFNGDVTYLRDEHGRIYHRTSSVNPEWFQEVAANPDTKASTAQVKNLIKKMKEGKKLGNRQYKIAQELLDVASTKLGEDEASVEAQVMEHREDILSAIAQSEEMGALYDKADRLGVSWDLLDAVEQSGTYEQQVAQLNKLISTQEYKNKGGIELGARPGKKEEDLTGYEKMPEYVHGDLDAMRTMLHKLHVLGGSKASPEMIRHYESLFERMHPRFFNELVLYVKENGIMPDGSVDVVNGVMKISVAPDNTNFNNMSEAEIYVHETVHSITAWAMRNGSNVGHITSQLDELIQLTSKHLTWEHFLTVPAENATEVDIEIAKAKRDYVLTRDEFMSYGLTNPTVMGVIRNIKVVEKRESTTLLNKLFNLFGTLIDVVLGRYSFKDKKNDVTAFEKLNELVFELAEHNRKGEQKLSSLNRVARVFDVLNTVDSFAGRQLSAATDAMSNKMPAKLRLPPNATVFERAKFNLQYAIKVFTDPLYRASFSVLLDAWHLKPDSSIREFAGGLFERDADFRTAERLNFEASAIDSYRNNVIGAVHEELNNNFSKPLADVDNVAITDGVLDISLSTLAYHREGRKARSLEDIEKLLTNDSYTDKEIAAVKKGLRDKLKEDGRYYWTVNQAKYLGHHMATHQGALNQVFNSYGIAAAHGIPEEAGWKYSSDIDVLVKELAILEAVKKTKKGTKNTLSRLLKEEPEGMSKVFDAHKVYLQESETQMQGRMAHFLEGHTQELFDASIDIRIAPLSDSAKLMAEGFELNRKVEPRHGDQHLQPMGLFVTKAWGKRERQKGAIAVGNLHSRGTTMRDSKYAQSADMAYTIFQRDFSKVRNNAISLTAQMMRGEVELSDKDLGMSPVYDMRGEITDFRYMMTKEEKAELLEQDRRATQVLPRSTASLAVATKRTIMNRLAFDFLLKDMAEHATDGDYGAGTLKHYSRIGRNVEDPQMVELYYLLPDELRDRIDETDNAELVVRTDLLNMMFGYHHARFTDAVGINKLPGFIKNYINMAEALWMELIKISKSAILIKMPAIIVTNIVSNIMLQVSTGSVDIPQLIRDYKESWAEVDKHLKDTQKIHRLKVQIESLKMELARTDNKASVVKQIESRETQIKALQAALDVNEAASLFNAGLYQTHVEDLGGAALKESNKLSKTINNVMNKVPTPVRWSAEVAYLTQNTHWYKAFQQLLQRSDMVARVVEKKRADRFGRDMIEGKRDLPLWWIKQQEEGYPATKVLTGRERKEFLEAYQNNVMENLIDNYVNYSIPNGKGEEYLNRVGFLMFTKYFKRVQTVIAKHALTNPVKVGATLLLNNMLLNTDIIQDQSMFAKGFRYGDFSVTNMVPVWGAGFHLENVLTPAIIKPELRMGLF